ncbi:hypothetical protein ASD76_16945 [Altererythrobacter sp. Root672]|nr:hypothetical protein ASD76_16945 [Altererythrobacter sp. Root672]
MGVRALAAIRAWLFRLLLILSLAFHQQAIARTAPLSDEQVAAIDRFIERQREATSIPGIALVVRRGGEIAYRRGIGMDGSGRPFSPATQVWLGSLSKSFTALAVAQLAVAKKIDLDQPVARYLPDFRMADPRGAMITVRNLMEHRSGLTDANLPDWGHPWPDTYAEATRRVQRIKALSSAPGTQIAYHNANYMVLADLVEHVSSEKFERYLNTHVFTPLDMRSALAVAHLDGGPSSVPPGHVFIFGRPLALRPPGMFIGGAGGVIANADDLSRWLEAFARSGRHPEEDRLLPPGMLASLLRPKSNAGYVYGYGWVLRQPGTDLVRHNGGLPTFVAHGAFAPDASLSIAVTTNGSLANPAWSEVGEDIADGVVAILAGQPVTTIPTARVGPRVDVAALAFVCLFAALTPLLVRSRRWRERLRAAQGNARLWIWFRASIVPALVIGILLVGIPAAIGSIESWSWFWLWFLAPVVTTSLWLLSLIAAVLLLWRWGAMRS